MNFMRSGSRPISRLTEEIFNDRRLRACDGINNFITLTFGVGYTGIPQGPL